MASLSRSGRQVLLLSASLAFQTPREARDLQGDEGQGGTAMATASRSRQLMVVTRDGLTA